MKNAYKYSLIAVSMAVLVLSCQKNPEMTAPEENPNLITLTCTFPSIEDENGTKVTLGTDGKTAWEADVDKIVFQGCPKVSGTSIPAVIHTITASEIIDPKTAVITVDLSSLTKDEGTPHDINVAYPADKWTSYSSDHMYGRSRFTDATNRLLMAGYINGSAIELMHVTAVLFFKVPAALNGLVDTYTIMGNKGEVLGYDKYLVELNSNSPTYLAKLGTATYGTLDPVTSLSGPVTADGTTVHAVYFQNEVNFTGGFTIQFNLGGDIKKTISTPTPLHLVHGHGVDLGLLPDTNIYDYVAPTTHDSSIDMTGATALDDSGTANCYIVDGSDDDNASKVFTFKAYKGNSTDGVGTVASAEILWETYNNAETVTANSVIAAVDFEKKSENDFYTMVFKMPATLHAGNAVLAAKDEGGNILWSWHIWVPQTTVTAADYGIHTSGKNVMDRNLGALVVAEASTSSDIDITSVGLYYQWGRKDPFPGPREIKKDPSDLYASPARVAGTAMTKDKVQLTVESSIKSPTFFARGYYDGDTQKNPDWCSEAGPNYWGDDGVKSVYDPCPVGYRVPLRDKTKALWADDITTQTGWAYNTDHYWFKVGSPAAVFPAVGYMDGGSIKTVFRTTIWNSHSNDYTNEYGFNHYAAYSRRIYLDGSTLKHKNNGDVSKSIGCSVRCVAE